MELKNFFAQDDQGNLLGGATCYLYARGTENLATGLQAANGTSLANPFTADEKGLIQFAAPNGLYDLRVVKGARDYRVRVQCLDVEESVAEADAAAVRAEVARDAAQLSAGVFADTAAGLAGTASGKYFSVPSATSAEYLILYKNNAGLAVEQKRYPSAGSVQTLEQKVLKALMATGSHNLADRRTISSNAETGVQARVRYVGSVDTKGLFVSLRLINVTGASYPASATDNAVFNGFGNRLMVQYFRGASLLNSKELIRLPDTDVWYYRDDSLTEAGVTEIKIIASPVSGVNFTFDECVIRADGGFGFPEIGSRDTAIAKAVLTDYENALLTPFREGSEANLLDTTSLTGNATLQLYGYPNRTLARYSAACIIEVDGAYPSDGAAFQCKAETFHDAGVLAATAVMKRIGQSKVWYVADIAAGTGPHTSVKITAHVPAGSTTITIRNAVMVEGGYASPLHMLLSSTQAAAISAAEAAAQTKAEQVVEAGLAGASVGWPSTALEALGKAASRRVDLVMLGDSNHQMDGKGFDFALRRALASRFGLYATAFGQAHSFGSNSGASTAQADKELASHPYRMLAAGESQAAGVANGIEVRASGHYPMNVSSTLRCHFAYSSFAAGAGAFRPGVRREESPWTVLQMAAQINTNTGAESYVRSYFDLAAGVRDGQSLGFKWIVPTQLGVTGPFLSYFMRIEDTALEKGVSCHTLYGVGGQSLWDMATQMNTYSMKQLTNYFAEVRRLQVERGLKPIVVIYVNSGLNDRNETSAPSLGWRASTAADSPTAYLDNLEAIAKRFSDVWQTNGWDERELFYLVIPSHPVSTPDDAELKGYRKAAWSFAGVRSRVSVVDFENLTSSDEMLANGWYKSAGADRNHLELPGYESLSSRIVALVP